MIRNTQTSMKVSQESWDRIFPKKEVTNVTTNRQDQTPKEIQGNSEKEIREQPDSRESS